MEWHNSSNYMPTLTISDEGLWLNVKHKCFHLLHSLKRETKLFHNKVGHILFYARRSLLGKRAKPFLVYYNPDQKKMISISMSAELTFIRTGCTDLALV